MPSTTQNNGLGAGFVGACLAAFLCLYALPLIAPAWDAAQAEPRYAAIARGKPATTMELDALIQALRATPWQADLSRAAFVQMLTAQQIGLHSLRATTRLAAARRDLRLGLAAAPSDSYAWTRLAISELHLGNNVAAAKALSVALQIAPNERKLTSLHFDLAVALWIDMDAAGRAAIERRLDAASKWPEQKAALAGNSSRALRERIAVEKDQ